eukprot:gnl/Dysnectes_brevis/2952_a3630_1120.p1 GENE.gnl/Dysnectes_brevis/2952_a3630_1120~~gnl/Dysnectes_brevis/2952_a3630_1120.p1  ORF type:complete len:790 (+),score=248.54 gnl/Dysnectes_brevis/2952_a3630_1120:1298-3667(+)
MKSFVFLLLLAALCVYLNADAVPSFDQEEVLSSGRCSGTVLDWISSGSDWSECLELFLRESMGNDTFSSDNIVNVPGATVSILVKPNDSFSDVIYKTASHGYINKDKGLWDDKKRFPAGSLSMMFTSIATLLKLNKEKVPLDTPLGDFISWEDEDCLDDTLAKALGARNRLGWEDKSKLTFLNLIMHQSGLDEWVFKRYLPAEVEEDSKYPTSQPSMRDVIKDNTFPKLVEQVDDSRPPKESIAGYTLLGKALQCKWGDKGTEDSSGTFHDHEGFIKLVNNILFSPAQMTDTTFQTVNKDTIQSEFTGVQDDWVANGDDDVSWIKTAALGSALPATNGVTTVKELSNLLASILANGKQQSWDETEGRFVNQNVDFIPYDVIMNMFSPQFDSTSAKALYEFPFNGYGFKQININHDVHFWVYDGDWPGCTSRVLLYLPDNPTDPKYAMVLAYNKRNDDMRYEMTQWFAHFIAGRDNSNPPNAFSRTSSVQDSSCFKGRYRPSRVPHKGFQSPVLSFLQSMVLRKTGGLFGTHALTFAGRVATLTDENYYEEIHRNIIAPKLPRREILYLSAYEDRYDPLMLYTASGALERATGDHGVTVAMLALMPCSLIMSIMLMLSVKRSKAMQKGFRANFLFFKFKKNEEEEDEDEEDKVEIKQFTIFASNLNVYLYWASSATIAFLAASLIIFLAAAVVSDKDMYVSNASTYGTQISIFIAVILAWFAAFLVAGFGGLFVYELITQFDKVSNSWVYRAAIAFLINCYLIYGFIHFHFLFGAYPISHNLPMKPFTFF